MITGLGLAIVLCSILAAVYAFCSYITGKVVAGWTSTILSIWFIGGVQLLSVGAHRDLHREDIYGSKTPPQIQHRGKRPYGDGS